MPVSIKNFDVKMEVKNKGVEFAVYDNDDTFRGDVIITKSGIIWCNGRTVRKNGTKATWNQFIEWMNSEE